MATFATYTEEEYFNVYWKIKNFSYCCEQILSPCFHLSGETCRLLLNPGFHHVECNFFYIFRRDFNIEISFLTWDGSLEESISGNTSAKLLVPKDVIFKNRRKAFLPEDTLTVRLRLRWSDTFERGKIFICSQIGVKRKYFLWTFKYLSDYLYSSEKSAESSTLLGDIKLKLKSMGGINSDEQFSIEVSRTGGERCYCVLRISVLDVDGKALNEVSDEFFFQKQDAPQTRGFPSIIKRSKWIGYKNLLLSEDRLSLKCFLAVSTGKVSEETADIWYCESAAPLLKESDDLLRNFKGENDSRSVTDLQIDLKSILENETLFDVSLQVGSEILLAHKTILSARSSVFRAMFAKGMKQTSSSTVVIEDFDVETVRGFLLYMYTDTLHDEQWENMKKLYFAADKYEVLSLREKCVSFLKTNLSTSNVCEALLLADLHQDEDMMSTVRDFISENDSAVFASEAWKDLEKNNSSLAFHVLREICSNKRFK